MTARSHRRALAHSVVLLLAGFCLACCSACGTTPDIRTPNGGLPVDLGYAATATEAAEPSPVQAVNTPTAPADASSMVPMITAEVVPTASPFKRPVAGAVTQQAYRSSVQLAESGSVTNTLSIGYLLYLPRAYGQGPGERWPLILFLQGSEERGDDPQAVRVRGLPHALDEGLELPAIVVSPQCPEGIRWWQWTGALEALLSQVESQYLVDSERVYLTGFSMGAYGAWAMALQSPARFAAMVPVAGGCDFRDDSIPSDICDLLSLPVWVFHGARDSTVAPSESENAVKALRACGGDVQFTLYPDADHLETCEITFADRRLYDWLLGKARKPS